MKPSQLIAGIKKLDPTPQILPKLQKLLRDPDSSLAELVELIRIDMSLTAQLIRVSNGVGYGSSKKVNSIDDAVKRIGYDHVYKVVGAAASKKVLEDELKIYGYGEGELWRVSVTCAIAMQSLAYKMDEDRDTAYTIGLLHGLGMVLIEKYYHDNGGIEGFSEEMFPISTQVEDDTLGFTYAEVGSTLLFDWKFLKDVFFPIKYQDHPHLDPSQKSLSQLLSLTKSTVLQLAYESDIDKFYSNYTVDETMLAELNLTQEDLIDAALNAQDSMSWMTG